MKLYEITADIRLLLEQHEVGEINDEQIADMLEQVGAAWDEKAHAVAAYILELEAQAAAMQDVIDGIQDRMERVEKRADSMRDYLKAQMKAVCKTKIECTEFTIGVRKNPPCVVLTDAVPANFMTTPKPPEPRPNLTAIKAMLQEMSEPCDFAHLEQGERLEIKS